jgi:hypothetical protein
MSGRKISIRASLRAAFEFARVNAPKTVGVLSIILVFDLAAVFTPASAAFTPTVLVLRGLEALFGVVAQGALYRLALAGAHGGDPEFRAGPLGLQWGKPETRLLGAHLLLYFLLFLGLLFWVIIMIVTLGAGMFATSTGAGPLGSASLSSAPISPTPQQASQLLLTFAPFGVIALFVYLRICLYGVATVAERKIAVFSTWRLTRGHVWPLFAAVLLIAAPIGLLDVVANLPDVPRDATLVLELLACVVDAFLIRPMYCGLYAHVYAGLQTSAPLEVGAVAAARGPWG